VKPLFVRPFLPFTLSTLVLTLALVPSALAFATGTQTTQGSPEMDALDDSVSHREGSTRPDKGAVLEAPPKIQGGYSTQPLERSVFSVEETAVRMTFLNEWLIHNHSTLDPDSSCGPREHLYYLIDTWVKHLYASEQVVLPRSHDLVLEILFSWSERLGAYGGNLVYNEVKRDDQPELLPLMPMPDGFDLSLRDDMFVVAAKDWTFTVPYYFMIWHVADFEAVDGPRTQMVALSTGAASHKGQEGYSQATLALLFGPGAEGPEFTRYWMNLYGFTGEEPESIAPGQPRRTRKLFDEDRNLRFEYATWKSPKGQFLVVYSGIEGTYQWNRPHFLDFLRSIHER